MEDPTRAQSYPSPPSNFAHFTSTHSIFLPTIDVPHAMEILAMPPNLPSVARLSSLCQDVKLQSESHITIDLSDGNYNSIEEKYREWGELYRIPPGGSTAEHNNTEKRKRNLLRIYFELTEGFSLLWGIVVRRFNLVGCQSVDVENGVCLYESYCDQQKIWIWKVRKFKNDVENEIEGVRVEEEIRARCSPLMKWVVERECRKAHQQHMNLYHTLFEKFD